MKLICLEGGGIVIGVGALTYLKEVDYKKCVLVTGSSSMNKSGVLEKVRKHMEKVECDIYIHSGVTANPTKEQIDDGVVTMCREQPDLILAVGGGSTIDAAKIMALFYEFPEISFENVNTATLPARRRKVKLIAVPSTSGTGSEVTAAAVYTDTEKRIKVPVKTPSIRPDLAILDPEIPVTMPKHIAAETGMDALTHAIESYINHGMDDFMEGICRASIEGLIKWLPQSCETAAIDARGKVHYYQCMAGMSFANAGLGMVHGIAHSFGGIYDIAHGLANAVILPYVMRYNSRDSVVKEKLGRLSVYCGGRDIVQQIVELKERLGIPKCFEQVISESDFKKDFEPLVDYSLQTGTIANPVKMTVDEMKKMVNAVYYGGDINW
jgi:alcohol dehydrogenase class IV